MHDTVRSLIGGVFVALGFSGAAQAQPAVAEPAPDFRLQDQHGEWHTLKDYEGRWVALYFYRRDDTPWCTKLACACRDNSVAFDELGAVVLGVSLDDVESHEAFAEKYSLPFSILADTAGDAAERYGVKRSFAGIKLARRQSFIIDPAGRIAVHYEKVDPETHSTEVLTDLRRLIAATQTP